MFLICESSKCTGCGMCSNICPEQAIEMKEGKNGFIFPLINSKLCINCGLCNRQCPSNNEKVIGSNVIKTYAGWNKELAIREKSTSGGLFSAFAEQIINDGGVVAGVAWNEMFIPEHILVDKLTDIKKFLGSKYSQSNTGEIYKKIKEILDSGRKVLFSGTPCQNAGLKKYLIKDYSNLFTIDLVCHGVPSNKMLLDYYSLFGKKIIDVRLRYKDPYWDYSYVRIDFEKDKPYQELTINDDYFNLFNIGYSLRESCHNCLYASTHRQADITLADLWGFTAHNIKTQKFNKGISLILVNSEKGLNLLDSIKDKIFIEEYSLENAKNGNKCLKESFKIDQDRLNDFWTDYNNGIDIHNLNEKYCAHTFKLPHFLILRRIYHKYKWIIKR